MSLLQKVIPIVAVAALMPYACVMAADSSTISVTGADGVGISFKNSTGSEIEKSIDEITQQQSKNGISKVITVKSESPKLIPTDIYIRISATDKAVVQNTKIEITNSAGELLGSEEVQYIEENGKYSKDIYLGCFNTQNVEETRIFTLLCEKMQDISIGIVSDPRRSVNPVENGISTKKDLADIRIRSGVYYVSTSNQLQLNTADGTVTLFKAAGMLEMPELVHLNEGDVIEYCSRVYLSEEAWGRKLGINSFSVLAPGYYTDINNGFIQIYNENGVLEQTYISHLFDNTSAYILNAGTIEKSVIETDEEQEIIHLENGGRYTVGLELSQGDYIAEGNGTVRVYDTSGYAKTVIKLKTKDSEAEGVESYVFKLNYGETFVVEGDIEFRK